MNVLVLDETMELAVPIRGLASISGWEPHFVGSLHELEVAVAAHGRPALTVVNLQPPLTAWELGQRLRGLGLESPVVVLGQRGERERRRRRWRGCSGWSGRAGRGSWRRRWSGW